MKMNALDSPLEVLAFNYLSFGFLTVVNNMWTWVAVVTAAVSFWRIRASSSSSSCSPNSQTHPRDSNPGAKAKVLSSSSPPDSVPATEPSTSGWTTSVCAVESTVDGVAGGKFTVYYNEDDGQCDDQDDVGGGGGADELDEGDVVEVDNWVVGRCEWRCVCDVGSWERVTMMRSMGMEAWYRFQDLRVLDGSVVRLWEGRCRRRNAGSASAAAAVFCWL